MAHANARLTFHGRCLLVRRVVLDGRPVAHVAKELGVSRQCAHRWVNRYRAEGWPGLQDRRSSPHRRPTRTPAHANLTRLMAMTSQPSNEPHWERVVEIALPDEVQRRHDRDTPLPQHVRLREAPKRCATAILKVSAHDLRRGQVDDSGHVGDREPLA